MKTITQVRLKELLDYNPNTGMFTWRVDRGKRADGSVAGYKNGTGYWLICIDSRMYFAHRLAWLYVYAECPTTIDHINCIRSDNRIVNLRAASPTMNNANMRRIRSNTSGFKGVCWSKPRKKWQALIQVKGKRMFLGYSDSAEGAYAIYCAAANKHFGEFARLK